MSWVRLDDGIYKHRKLLPLRKSTRWIWVAGLAYSSDQRLDGLVPDWALHTIGATAHDRDALVAAGLWVPDAGGWQIHDYGDYQPVNGELSRKRSEAGRKGAQARWQVP